MKDELVNHIEGVIQFSEGSSDIMPTRNSKSIFKESHD